MGTSGGRSSSSLSTFEEVIEEEVLSRTEEYDGTYVETGSQDEKLGDSFNVIEKKYQEEIKKLEASDVAAAFGSLAAGRISLHN